MINKLNQLSISQKTSLYVVLFLFLRTLNITINETIHLSASVALIVKLILILSFGLIDIFLFFQLKKSDKIHFVITELIAFLLLLLTSVRYPSIGISVFSSYGWIIISFIPIIISILHTDLDTLYNYLHGTSYFITLLCTLIYFFHIRNLSTNLVFSYTLLLPFLIHINEFIKKKNILIFILILFESYMLLTYGSRGTLVCAVLFVVFLILKKIGLKNLKYFIGICLIIFSIYEIMYFTGVFDSIYQYYLEEGRYIRILDLISKGEFFSNNGRFEIYHNYFGYILEKPFLGWGIGADIYIGIFPHNLLIELIFNFGIILGTILIIIMIILIAKLLLNNNHSLFLILFCSGILPLFFSFSYLEWMNFWIFIGYILLSNKKYISDSIQKMINLDLVRI